MASFEQKITHGDQTQYVLGLNLKALLEELSCLFQVSLLQINNTELAECLVVLRIILDHKLVVRNCALSIIRS